MNNRSGRQPENQDNFPMNTIQLAAYAAAKNGMLFGVTAGLTGTLLLALVRRGNTSQLKASSLVTRPLALGSLCSAVSYVSAYSNNTPLTLFVRYRTRKQLEELHAQEKHLKEDSHFSVSKKHN